MLLESLTLIHCGDFLYRGFSTYIPYNKTEDYCLLYFKDLNLRYIECYYKYSDKDNRTSFAVIGKFHHSKNMNSFL